MLITVGAKQSWAFSAHVVLALVRRVRGVFEREPVLFKLKEKKVGHLFCKFVL